MRLRSNLLHGLAFHLRCGRAARSRTSIAFMPEDWREGQELLVTPLARPEGRAVVLRTSRAKSIDPEFAGLPVDDLELSFLPDLLTHASARGEAVETPAPGGAGSSGRSP